MSVWHDLHQRYQQQVEWTASIRPYLIARCALPESLRVLEVGCGTGALLACLRDELPPSTIFHGIDIEWNVLPIAHTTAPAARLTQSNALRLPHPDAAFDLVCCHFLLLWAKPLRPILCEMVRVLKPGGHLIAFAEPDYSARIDHPSELIPLGRLQEQALARSGARTSVGRELGFLFAELNLRDQTVGLLGGQWTPEAPNPAFENEWDTLQRDLSLLEEAQDIDWDALKALDRNARVRGERILYVPTFYAIGTK